MTRTTPRRRTILQCSQILFTLDRTFMVPSVSVVPCAKEPRKIAALRPKLNDRST